VICCKAWYFGCHDSDAQCEEHEHPTKHIACDVHNVIAHICSLCQLR
jgi:hypothetical protein